MNRTWPTYQLKYKENGREKSMEVAMTFADFAITEGRFRKHFRKVPRDAWNDDMIELVDFLEMSEDDREGKFPYIWAVDRKATPEPGTGRQDHGRILRRTPRLLDYAARIAGEDKQPVEAGRRGKQDPGRSSWQDRPGADEARR
jgi:hypothetical protein